MDVSVTNHPRGSTPPAVSAPVSSAHFDSLLTMAQAAQLLPRINGRQLTAATVWRWCRKGINGIYLEHQCIGRAIVTTQSALDRFFRRLADRDNLCTPQPEEPSAIVQPGKEEVCPNP